MRLDRFLCLDGEYSRKEAGQLLKSGRVCVDGKPICSAKYKLEAGKVVTLDGVPVHHTLYRYYMMNKPEGVLTAARDSRVPTVMDLLPPQFLKKDILPVGRLDKDSTGLLLFTNNGKLTHQLLAPKTHVWKCYEVCVVGRLEETVISLFEAGMDLKEFVTRPAKLAIIDAEEAQSRAVVSIREGKYHQVKRMFAHVGHEVIHLHRSRFGPIALDEGLRPGQFRELTPEEAEALLEAVISNDSDGLHSQNEEVSI